MMESSTIPAEDVRETAPTVDEPGRPPLRDLLPVGVWRAIVVAGSVGLLVAAFVVFGFTGHALLGAVLCPTLLLLGAIDFEHHLLPNDIMFPAVLAVGLIVAAADPGSFLTHFVAGAALGGFFLLFAVFFKGSLGIGDVKLGFLIGLALGRDTPAAAMIALVGLLVAALTVIAREGVGARRKAIPFGPFLAIGGIVVYFLS
jgi:prepilin signal peptidase PulO-like enzyme (type II secretory pathway)